MNETEEKVTSADIKKQIQEATKAEKMKDAVKDGSLNLTPGVVNEINASESITAVTPKAESKSEPVKATEKVTAESVNLKEWAKNKGIDWTTEESVLSALRKSDQEFHKRQAEKKAKEAMNPVAPAYIPPPAQPPMYQMGVPTYAPPPNTRQIIEELARQNNMTPEDFERVAKVSREVYEAAAMQDRQRWSAEMEAIRVENQKNSVFRELSSDPVFRRPEVAMEFHNVMEQMQASDPASFEKDPTQYVKAYDRALSNIGRRNLEGKPLIEGVPPTAQSIPNMPPRSLGKGSGGGYNENEGTIDPQAFAKLSVEEKRKVLEGMGLRSQYQ